MSQHRIDPARITARSLRTRAYREGLSRGYIIYHWNRQFISQPKRKLKSAIDYLKQWIPDFILARGLVAIKIDFEA